jgi:type I restriction enzyme R subunit
VVISDEAHRSQYGTKGRLDQEDRQVRVRLRQAPARCAEERHLHRLHRHADCLEDKDTRAVFGDYVSIYDIQDAVDDGATVPIFYESRLAKLDVNQAEIDALNEQVEEVVEDEEDIASREEDQERMGRAGKAGGRRAAAAASGRGPGAALRGPQRAVDGKAMIVCMSRDICVQLYKAIVTLRPNGTATIRSKACHQGGDDRLGGRQGAAAAAPLQQAGERSAWKALQGCQRPAEAGDRARHVADRLRCACCHTMYVDKPMKGHNLMQAIARVNRVFKNKPGGLVVDYIGIANELKARSRPTPRAKGKGDPTHNAAEALAVLLEKMDVVRGMMHGFDYSAFETRRRPCWCLQPTIVLGLKDGKQRFLDTMVAVAKAFRCAARWMRPPRCARRSPSSRPSRRPSPSSPRWTRSARCRREEQCAQADPGQRHRCRRRGRHLCAGGPGQAEHGLLSDEFLEDVRQMESRNLAVELLEKLLRDEIKARARNNVVQEKKYGDRLLETCASITTAPSRRPGDRRADPDGQGVPGRAGARARRWV